MIAYYVINSTFCCCCGRRYDKHGKTVIDLKEIFPKLHCSCVTLEVCEDCSRKLESMAEG